VRRDNGLSSVVTFIHGDHGQRLRHLLDGSSVPVLE
jgi:hypothetical protein